MKTIILGREGNQPFPIKAECDGVSRRHAQITITEQSDWYLEDLDSSNGTFIRDESTGDMIPINTKRRITPMTFILLGPDNSKGCCFFAKQADKYGDFTEEREYLISKEEEFDRRNIELEANIKKMRIIGPIALCVLGLLITFIPDINKLMDQNTIITVRILIASISGLIPVFYDGAARKRQLQEERDRWHHCPNPCCSNKQTSKEIKNMRCSKCKK